MMEINDISEDSSAPALQVWTPRVSVDAATSSGKAVGLSHQAGLTKVSVVLNAGFSSMRERIGRSVKSCLHRSGLTSWLV